MKLVDYIPPNPKVMFIMNSQEACGVPLHSGEPPIVPDAAPVSAAAGVPDAAAAGVPDATAAADAALELAAAGVPDAAAVGVPDATAAAVTDPVLPAVAAKGPAAASAQGEPAEASGPHVPEPEGAAQGSAEAAGAHVPAGTGVAHGPTAAHAPVSATLQAPPVTAPQSVMTPASRRPTAINTPRRFPIWMSMLVEVIVATGKLRLDAVVLWYRSRPRSSPPCAALGEDVAALNPRTKNSRPPECQPTVEPAPRRCTRSATHSLDPTSAAAAKIRKDAKARAEDEIRRRTVDGSMGTLKRKAPVRGDPAAASKRRCRAASEPGTSEGSHGSRGRRVEGKTDAKATKTAEIRITRARSNLADDHVSLPSSPEAAPDKRRKRATREGNGPKDRRKKLNVRCNPGDILQTIKMMSDAQLSIIRQQGFGKLLRMTVDALESRSLLGWLLDRTSPVDMKIHAGPGRVLPITKDIISQVLGLPRVGGALPKTEFADHVRMKEELRGQLHLKADQHLSVTYLQDVLTKGKTDDFSIQCFFMILLNRLLLPSSSDYISGPVIALSKHWKSFGSYDWSQVLYNDLSQAVVKWHERDTSKRTTTVYGCAMFFIVYYIDNFDHKKSPADCFTTPRVIFYDKNLIEELTRADMRQSKDGTKSYGNCPFKSWSSTCYAHFAEMDNPTASSQPPPSRPARDCPSSSAIYVPLMSEIMAPRIMKMKGPKRKLAQQIWLDYDREIQPYVRTLNHCHDQIVSQQLRAGERFQRLLEEDDDEVRRTRRSAKAEVKKSQDKVDGPTKDKAIPGAAKAARTPAVPITEIVRKSDAIKFSRKKKKAPITTPEEQVPNDEIPSDGFSRLSSLATLGDPSISQEIRADDMRYRHEIEDTAAAHGGSSTSNAGVDGAHTTEHTDLPGDPPLTLSPLPTHLPPDSQLTESQVNVMIDKIVKNQDKGKLQQEGRAHDPETSNETFTHSYEAADAEEAMDRACSRVYEDPNFAEANMNDDGCDYTPGLVEKQAHECEAELAEDIEQATGRDCQLKMDIGTRLIRRPAKFLSPFKTGRVRKQPTSEHALNLRAFLLSGDCELTSQYIMQYDSVAHTGRDIAESFGDGTFTDNFMIDAFISCLRDDDRVHRPESFGYRFFTKIDVGNVANCEEISGWHDEFDEYALDQALKRSLPPHDLVKDAKLIFIPLWHRSHWSVYVINLIHLRIDILDSADYGGVLGDTSWADHHQSLHTINGQTRPWNKIMMQRLNDSFHRVCPRGTLPVFSHWRALPIYGLPRQDINDCAFCVMRFLEFYDGDEGTLTVAIPKDRSDLLRGELLHYLVFHPRNEIKKLPDALEQFRARTPLL
ncbi:hypothetical protein ACP70R_012328 [Stipagrostis hirtigluma subsp. patula]